MLYWMNLQLFAEGEGGAAGNGQGADNQPGGTEQQQGNPEPQGNGGKIYTQQELDAAIANKMRKQPPKEEIERYRKWVKEHPEEGQPAQQPDERDATIERLTRERDELLNIGKVEKAGIAREFSEFVAHEVCKSVTDEKDFDTVLAEYTANHPQFKGAGAAWGMKQGSGAPEMDGVERAFYERNPALK